MSKREKSVDNRFSILASCAFSCSLPNKTIQWTLCNLNWLSNSILILPLMLTKVWCQRSNALTESSWSFWTLTWSVFTTFPCGKTDSYWKIKRFFFCAISNKIVLHWLSYACTWYSEIRRSVNSLVSSVENGGSLCEEFRRWDSKTKSNVFKSFHPRPLYTYLFRWSRSSAAKVSQTTIKKIEKNTVVM